MAGLDIQIHEQLKKNGSYLKCIKANTGGDGAGGTSNPTVSDTAVVAALASATANTYTYAEGDNIRAVEIQTNGGGTGETIQIQITKADGSVLTFNSYHGSAWGYEGLITEAPITEIIVTNNVGTAVDYIINVVSRA